MSTDKKYTRPSESLIMLRKAVLLELELRKAKEALRIAINVPNPVAPSICGNEWVFLGEQVEMFADTIDGTIEITQDHCDWMVRHWPGIGGQYESEEYKRGYNAGMVDAGLPDSQI